MRRTLTIWLLMLLLSMTGKAESQSYFFSEKLRRLSLAEGVTIVDEKNTSQTGSFFRRGVEQYPLLVEWEGTSIRHIGFDLLGANFRAEEPVISRFVERYLLELTSLYSEEERKSIQRSDGVTLRGDFRNIWPEGGEKMVIAYNIHGNESGVLSVSSSGRSDRVFEISFPLKTELLLGMDKPELEAFFIKEVMSFRKKTQERIPDNLSRIDENLYVSENGFFESKAIQNTSFFRKRQFTYHPVWESESPTESVMTLLTSYTGGRQFQVHLLQNGYGYSSTKVDIPLEQLLGYCMESGCTPYVGIESNGKDLIVATLFMVNLHLGYCHTFKFSIRKDLLASKVGAMDATAYTFTPIHNIKV